MMKIKIPGVNTGKSFGVELSSLSLACPACG